MKALGFLFAAAILLALPVCPAFAQGSGLGTSVQGVALRPIESSAVQSASPSADVQQAPPADSGAEGPGSGPPASMTGGPASAMMAAGVVAALVVAGLLIRSILKKEK
jgi:hypothetical protein